MSTQGAVIRDLLTPGYKTNTGSITRVWTDGAGSALDTLDPNQTGLANQFSISASSGSALDKNGADWQVYRYAGETDSAFRARILAKMPALAQGPTVAALKQVVAAIVGTTPIVSQRAEQIVTFPITFPVVFGAATPTDAVYIDLTISNPNNVTFSQNAVIQAIRTVRRAIAVIVVHWTDGTTTTINS